MRRATAIKQRIDVGGDRQRRGRGSRAGRTRVALRRRRARAVRPGACAAERAAHGLAGRRGSRRRPSTSRDARSRSSSSSPWPGDNAGASAAYVSGAAAALGCVAAAPATRAAGARGRSMPSASSLRRLRVVVRVTSGPQCGTVLRCLPLEVRESSRPQAAAPIRQRLAGFGQQPRHAVDRRIGRRRNRRRRDAQIAHERAGAARARAATAADRAQRIGLIK